MERMKKLKLEFSKAVAELTQEPFVLMFSGGVDSSLIAKGAKDAGCDFIAICVGFEGSEDLEIADKVAEKMELKFEKIVIGGGGKEIAIGGGEREIAGLYEKVANIIGDELMEVELGIPVYLCAKKAREKGIAKLVLGSGAEELFAGYTRHAQAYENGEKMREVLDEAFAKLMKVDVPRNERVAREFGVDVVYPFLYKGFVAAARAFEPAENFAENERKHVLRELAREVGVPEEACSRVKKAMQYGSGIHKVVFKLKGKGKR